MIKKREQVLLVAISVFIILFGAFYFYISTENLHMISALDAKKMADERALELDKNLRPYSVIGIGEYSDNGKCEGWMFKYRADSNDSNRAVIKVWWNGNIESYEDDFSTVAGFITNWTIDSDEAYSIAMKNEEIKSFMERYRGAHVDRFSLSGRHDGNPVWRIEWVDWGIWDDPHSAEIKIDATTGEVLYVETAPGSSLSMQDICIGAFVVLIAVVAAVVLIARKKSRKEQEKRRLEEEKINMENEMRKWDEEHGKRG